MVNLGDNCLTSSIHQVPTKSHLFKPHRAIGCLASAFKLIIVQRSRQQPECTPAESGMRLGVYRGLFLKLTLPVQYYEVMNGSCHAERG